MKVAATLLLLTLAPSAGLAEGPVMTADEFDAASQGKTMTWSDFGVVYGIEEYLPGRRVRWALSADLCQTGRWYPMGDAICFAYDGNPDQYCWTIRQSGDGLLAFDTAEPPDRAPVEIMPTDQPLTCTGPDVGV
ncbi:MAG: hypothetical protein HC844_17385 [Tabrizicola sp.]|nr:hypothetical protein [Tabrizicola sp.]